MLRCPPSPREREQRYRNCLRLIFAPRAVQSQLCDIVRALHHQSAPQAVARDRYAQFLAPEFMQQTPQCGMTRYLWALLSAVGVSRCVTCTTTLESGFR